MGIESREKTINGKTYLITQFPARKALNLKIKLAKIIAAGVGKGSFDITAIEKAAEAGNEEAAGNSMVTVIANIVAGLSESEFDTLTTELLSMCSIRTATEILDVNRIFDTLYAGNLMEMYKALFAVIEVNYPDFFGEGSMLGRAITGMKAAKAPTSAPNTSV